MDKRLKRYQKEFEHSYTYGVFTTLELLQARPQQCKGVMLSSRGEESEGVAGLRALCTERAIPISTDDKVVARLSPRKSHLAIGVFEKYDSRLDAVNNHVVLVSPGDMGNLGTICRTMLGFGVSDLALIRPAVDAFDPKAVRASMGAVFSMSIEYFDSYEEYCQRFSRKMYALMTNGQESIRDVSFEQPFSLIFGNESSGLPDDFAAQATSIQIPQRKQIDSFNLSVAVAITLYESVSSSSANWIDEEAM